VLISSVGFSLAHWKDAPGGPILVLKGSLPRNCSDGIQRVPSIFVPRNRIPVIFSSAEDSESNSKSSFYFCSRERNSELFSLWRKGLERNSESFLFRETAGIPSEIPICSGYSVFRGIIFFLEIPDPSSEPSRYPSGELQTVFGMAAYTLSDETIKFFLVRCHINILSGLSRRG
jgi:hypothetical protein